MIQTGKGEKELLADVATGDQNAFKLLYDKYSDLIFSVAVKYLENESDTEEVIQEIFIKIWEKRSLLINVVNFKSWLYIAARNTIYDHFERQQSERRRQQIYASLGSSSIDDTSHRLEDRKYAEILHKAIEKMSPQRRRVYLSRQQGTIPATIARDMNLSVSTVRNHLKAANMFIREYVKNNLDLMLIAAILFGRR